MAAPSGAHSTFVNKRHLEEIISSLNRQRSELGTVDQSNSACSGASANYCDVAIKVSGGRDIFAHSSVLAAASPYFAAFLGAELPRGYSQRAPQLIEIHVNPEGGSTGEGAGAWMGYERAVESVLGYIYTGVMRVDRATAACVVEIARLMQLDALILFCESLLLGKLGSLVEGEVFEITNTPPVEPNEPPTDCAQLLTNLALIQTNLSSGLNSCTSLQHRAKAARMNSVSTQVRPKMLGFPEPSERRETTNRATSTEEVSCASKLEEGTAPIKRLATSGRRKRFPEVSGSERTETPAERLLADMAVNAAGDISTSVIFPRYFDTSLVSINVQDSKKVNGHELDKITELEVVGTRSADMSGVEIADKVKMEQANIPDLLRVRMSSLQSPNLNNMSVKDITSGDIICSGDVKHNARPLTSLKRKYQRKAVNKLSESIITGRNVEHLTASLPSSGVSNIGISNVGNASLRHSTRARRKTYKLAVGDISDPAFFEPQLKTVVKRDPRINTCSKNALTENEFSHDSLTVSDDANKLENGAANLTSKFVACSTDCLSSVAGSDELIDLNVPPSDASIIVAAVCKRRWRRPKTRTTRNATDGATYPRFFCADCPFATRNVRQMSLHKRGHMIARRACYYCDATFDNTVSGDKGGVESGAEAHLYDSAGAELEAHLREHETHRLPFMCRACGQRFRARTQLSLHLPKHSSDKPYVCPVCRGAFKWKTALSAHLSIHAGSQREEHLCDVCGYATLHRGELRAHKLVHTGDTLRCPYKACDFRATKAQNLKYHLLTHTQEKAHQCEVCGRSFSLVKNLKRHMLLHTAAKNHRCERCEFASTRYDKLKEHMHRSHSLGSAPERRLRITDLVQLNNSQPISSSLDKPVDSSLDKPVGFIVDKPIGSTLEKLIGSTVDKSVGSGVDKTIGSSLRNSIGIM